MTYIDTTFKIDSKSKISSFISWKKFRSDKEFIEVLDKFFKLKEEYLKDDEEYPKVYNETDEEWNWETIDFWPEGVSPKELLLVHEELKNGKEV